MTRSNNGAKSRAVALAPWLVIAGLVLFHAANNWIWLVENVTSTGWDKPRHLARSLNYTQMLSPISLRSLFGVMISDPVRPPLFPASASIVYKLFGYTADVATMVNVIYFAIALAATYGIGYLWGTRARGSRRAGVRLGLAGAVLLSFLPMFYSMSRYFYLEFALTAMVTLTVYLLLATDGFQRRGASLLFGLSLGLGLLTKRTFVVFAVGPVLAAILTSGLLPALWRRVRQRPTIHWRNVLVAVAGGLVPAALWYLPNRETMGDLLLGHSLFLFWWALAALAIYFATLPSAPLANALAAFFLAAGLASTWYLARIEFLQRVALYGYGIDDPRGRQLRLDRVDTYLYYIRKLGNEHLSSVVFFALLVLAVVALIVYVRRQGSVGAALRRVTPEAWAVLAWLAGGYLLLTLSIYQETRAFTPALPAVALLAAAALLALPWRRVRFAVGAVLLLFLLIQFFAVSYEPVQRLLPPVAARLPGWGRTTSFAQGVYIQLPDEGDTDSGYWIVPDVLARMEASRQAWGYEYVSLGLLANTTQLNAGPLNYLILTDYPALRVESLIDRFNETSPYRQLFGHDYVAVKRVNSGINPVQAEAIDEILAGPPLLFDRSFVLETTYDLPDGDTVYLYRRRHPLPAGYPVEYITRLAGVLGDGTRPGDAILLTPPELAGSFVSHYDGPADIHLLPLAEADLAEIEAGHGRILLVVGDAAAGDVDGSAQVWLDGHTFRAAHEWSDSLQLLTYGSRSPATAPGVETDALFVSGGAGMGPIALVGYDLPRGPASDGGGDSWMPGDVVPLTLFWRAEGAPADDYRVFVHLVDGNGRIVAQNDAAPAAGTRPTSSWTPGEQVADPHGLLLPAGPLDPPERALAPGEYRIYVGLYEPESGARLPLIDAVTPESGDSYPLATLRIGE
ncbi:MAG: glycosyltransferase family 39 protein [Anaerolineae bacterium]|jgi:4-amino-4-deoxy-L-arabinose transferase-like glycosyltransferase